MKKIFLKGKERTLTCNMRAMVIYQRITGVNPFDTDSHNDEQKYMYDFVIGWSMLPDADQEEVAINDIMEDIDTMKKQHEFSSAVTDELLRFYNSEPGDADDTDRHEVESNDDEDDAEDKYKKNV